MKIREILKNIQDRELPLVRKDETIRGVLKKMLQYPHTRLMYVIDKNSTCKGTISLEMLIKHLFADHFEPTIHPQLMIKMITSETAKDIMNTGFIYAISDDKVESVVKMMIKAGINEIAILDDQKKVIADITMLDLLKYCHLEENE